MKTRRIFITAIVLVIGFMASNVSAAWWERFWDRPVERVPPPPQSFQEQPNEPIFDDHEAAANQVIEWVVDRAGVAGSGCNLNDTYVIEGGDQVSIIYTGLKIELDDRYDTSLAARKNCTVVIPAKVKQGWYIGKLEQTLMYGYTRNNDNSSGSVSMTSRFFNYLAGRISEQIPGHARGESRYNVPQTSATSETYFSVESDRWCKYRNDYEGNYVGSLSITANRETIYDGIVVGIDGQDIKFEAVGHGYVCDPDDYY